MPNAQITGLASGIDWQETVALLMEIESQPVVMLEMKKDTYQQKLEAWQTINSKLLSLSSLMMSMNELDEMLIKAASSTDTTIATATASSGAVSGTYTLEVNQLAQADIWVHDGVADYTSVVNSSGSDQTFVYTVDGENYSVTVPDGTTLSELAALINDDVDNPGVAATILNDGQGDHESYHLVLTGQSGQSNAIIIDDGTLGNDLSGFIGGVNWGAGPTQAAQNAQIKVNGYPPALDEWIESETNEVTDVIAGITLNLISTNAGSTINISVSNDTSAVKDKIQEFVDAYNETVALINLKTKYDPETEEAEPLFGNVSAISMKNDLQSIIASENPGLADDALFKSMGDIGVSFGANGLLEIDDSKLSDAMEDDFDAVGDLFALTTSSNNSNLQYFYSTEATQGGVYNVVANYDASGNLTSATINGNAATIEGNYIIGADGQPEAGLRIEFSDPGGGAGSISAEIKIGTGTAVRIENRVSFITDPMDGTIHYAEESLNDTIENIDKQIERWEKRLETKQAQLEANFLNMEILISQMQSTGNYVSAMLSG